MYKVYKEVVQKLTIFRLKFIYLPFLFTLLTSYVFLHLVYAIEQNVYIYIYTLLKFCAI